MFQKSSLPDKYTAGHPVLFMKYHVGGNDQIEQIGGEGIFHVGGEKNALNSLH